MGFKILKTVSRDKVSFTPQFHVKEIDEFVHKATSRTNFFSVKQNFMPSNIHSFYFHPACFIKLAVLSVVNT